MSDSTNLNRLGSGFNTETLQPLLERANRISAALAAAQYDSVNEWVAEVNITLVHGLDGLDRIGIRPNEPLAPRFKVTARIFPRGRYRYFTLEEAELILEKLLEIES